MTPITNTNDLIAFCEAIKSAPFITVDTEFMRETTYWPKLCLIQAASEDHAAIIDPLAADLDMKPFLDILADEKVLKVFHACRQDMEIFVNLGVLPTKGLTLPLISSGGSSVMMTCAAIGLLVRVGYEVARAENAALQAVPERMLAEVHR